MRIPNEVRDGLREKLWAQAMRMGWEHLSWTEKSNQYDAWSRDPEVGGILARHMDQRAVRVYIKDTVMKGYGRWRLADSTRIFRVLGLSDTEPVRETYQRPHGRLLRDGRLVCWGNASDWKAVLMAIHERAYLVKSTTARPGEAVLLAAGGRFADPRFRAMVQDGATKLGVPRVVWVE